jgi:glycosyltransferase involved in cell wall biosynthesis
LLVLASTYPRWSDDPEPGFVHELSKRLTGQFEVSVLCPHAAGAAIDEVFDGVRVLRYRYAPVQLETLVNDGGIVTNLRRAKWKLMLVPTFVLAQAWAAWRLLRREKIDVIHAHWLIPQGLIAALLQFLPGRKVPFVVTSHGADLYALRGRRMNSLKRFVLKRAAAATVVSAAMRETLQSIGAEVAKVSVQPMGVDLSSRFTPDEAVPRSSRELLFVGRLVEKKGLRYLIDAMPEVLRRFPDAHLTVAGFGPQESMLKAQVHALRLGGAVSFLGAVSQARLPELYRRSRLFVAPFVRADSGDEEGLGLVLVEAVGCGCPILAGNVPALAEVLGTAITDMAVDPHDTHALAAKVLETLQDPATTLARAVGLRAGIVQRFDWYRVANAYAQLLGGALQH